MVDKKKQTRNMILFCTLMLLSIGIVTFITFVFINFFDGLLYQSEILKIINIKNYVNYINIIFYVLLIYIYWNLIKIFGKYYQSHLKIRNVAQHGDRKFESLKNMDTTYNKVFEKGYYPGKGGVVVGWDRLNNMIYLDDGAVNNLVIGTSRSGKGVSFVIPTLDAYSRAKNIGDRASFIVTDPKGELAEMISDKLAKRGYDIKIINILDPAKSSSYNPLDIIIDYWEKRTGIDQDKAETLITTLGDMIYAESDGDGKIWNDLASNLFRAVGLLLLELYEQKLEIFEKQINNLAEIEKNTKLNAFKNLQRKKITIYNIYNIVNDYGRVDDKTNTSPLDDYMERLNPSITGIQSKAYNSYATIKLSGGNTLMSIYTTMMNGISKFTSSSIAKMMSSSNFSLADIGFGNKPIALFIVKPDFDATYDSIPSLFVSQLYYTLSERATLSENKQCKREVIFMLDEFGNMPAIKNMDNILTVCLGRKIRFNLIVQDYNQIKIKYEKAYETIKANCANHIYIMSNGLETRKEFSEVLGTYTVREESISGSFLDEKNISKNWKEQKLMSADKLSELKQGESIVIRPLTRRTKQGDDLNSSPIANLGKNRCKLSYEYMDLNSNMTIADLFEIIPKLTVDHIDYDLENNRIKLNFDNSEEQLNYFEIKNRLIKINDQSLDLDFTDEQNQKLEMFLSVKEIDMDKYLEFEQELSNNYDNLKLK